MSYSIVGQIWRCFNGSPYFFGNYTFRPNGYFVFSLVIQCFSWCFRCPVDQCGLWSRPVTVMASIPCVRKCCTINNVEGLSLFILYLCWFNLVDTVFPVSPTYCRLHLVHAIKYTQLSSCQLDQLDVGIHVTSVICRVEQAVRATRYSWVEGSDGECIALLCRPYSLFFSLHSAGPIGSHLAWWGLTTIKLMSDKLTHNHGATIFFVVFVEFSYSWWWMNINSLSEYANLSLYSAIAEHVLHLTLLVWRAEHTGKRTSPVKVWLQIIYQIIYQYV